MADTMDFTPVEFDASELPPEAAVGTYEATIDSVKVTGTSKDQFPMLIIEWKLDSIVEGGDDNSIGALVADFVTFFPKGHKAYRMSVLRFRALVDALGIDPEVVPGNIRSKSDFRELVDALRKKELTVYVTQKLDKSSGEMRTGVQYSAPKGAGLSNGHNKRDEEDEDEDRPAKKPTSKGKSRRN